MLLYVDGMLFRIYFKISNKKSNLFSYCTIGRRVAKEGGLGVETRFRYYIHGFNDVFFNIGCHFILIF